MAEQWLTYQKAGEALGVSPDAVRRHAQRKGWRVQRGNDGKALVLIPATAADEPWARAAAQHGARAPAHLSGQVREGSPDLLAELRRRAEVAEARANAEAEGRREAEVMARVQAGQVAEFRQNLGRAQREAEVLQDVVIHERGQVAAERQRAEALRAERDRAQAELSAWTAGGPLTRAWRAFVNRRGG